MRVNLKNAVSFEINEEITIGTRIENGFNKDKYRFDIEEQMYFKKSNVLIDFGTFKRTIWFDTELDMDNFISQQLPPENHNAIITE